jgi:hypothetical protein
MDDQETTVDKQEYSSDHYLKPARLFNNILQTAIKTQGDYQTECKAQNRSVRAEFYSNTLKTNSSNPPKNEKHRKKGKQVLYAKKTEVN